MQIVELAFQGIRELPALVRLSIAPTGLFVLPAAEASRRRALIDATFHTIQPEAGDHQVLGPMRTGPGPWRSSVTFLGKEGTLYRLVRDFSNGSTRLFRQLPAPAADGSRFAVISEDRVEVARWLRVEIKLPADRTYERLFVLSPDSLALKGPAARSRRGDALFPTPQPIAPSAPGLPPRAKSVVEAGALRAPSPAWGFEDYGMNAPGMAGLMEATEPALLPRSGSALSAPPAVKAGAPAPAPAPVSIDVEARIRDYHHLKRRVEAALSARSVLAELDQLQRRRETLRPRVEMARELAAKLEVLRTNQAVYKDLDQLPGDIGERVRIYETAGDRRTADLRRIAEEHRDAQLSLDQEKLYRLFNDNYFRAGAATFVLAILAAVVFRRPGIALANILGALLAAASTLLHIRRLEKISRLESRISACADREARVAQQYELDTGAIRRLIAELKISDPSELITRVEEARTLERRCRELEDKRAELEMDPSFQSELAQLAQVDARLEVLEGQLTGIEGADASNPRELERELLALEEELTRAGVALHATTHRAPSRAGSVGKEAPKPPPGIRIVSGARIPAAAPTADEDEEEPGYGSGYGAGSGVGTGPSSVKGTLGAGVMLMAASDGPLTGPLGGGRASGGGSSRDLPCEPTAALVQAAADCLSQTVDGMAAMIKDRLEGYLRVLTRGAFATVAFGARGEVRFTVEGGASVLALEDVPAEHALSAEAALRLALLEQICRRLPLPVLIDDPFIALAPEHRGLLYKALRVSAQATQILLLTPASDIEGQPLAW